MSEPEAADGDTLLALLSLPPDALERAVASLVRRGEAAVPILAALEERAAGKAQRKIARRGLHVLRSGGVDVGERRAPAGRGSVLRPVARAEEEAFAAAPDPLGQRGATLLCPVRGGVRVCELWLSDSTGVLALRAVEVERRAVRSLLRKLREPAAGGWLPFPGAAVRALARRARALGCDPQVDVFALAEVCAGPEAPTPGEALRAELGALARALPLGEAERVVRARMQSGRLPVWPFLGPAVEEGARRLVALEESPIVLAPAHRQARQHEVLGELAERLLDAAARERLAARLEEHAPYLRAAGDEDGALAALREAQAFRDPGPGGGPPLARLLLERSLDLARERQRQEDRGRIVLPR